MKLTFQFGLWQFIETETPKLHSTNLPSPYYFLSVNNLCYWPNLSLPHSITSFLNPIENQSSNFINITFKMYPEFSLFFFFFVSQFTTYLVLPVSFLLRHGQLFPNWSPVLLTMLFHWSVNGVTLYIVFSPTILQYLLLLPLLRPCMIKMSDFKCLILHVSFFLSVTTFLFLF